jgi:hypothetical protein
VLKFLFSLVSGSPFKLYGALGAIILVSAILGIHLYGDSAVRKERDQLKAYKLSQTILAKAAIIENAKNLEQARAKNSLDSIVAQNQIDVITASGQKTIADISEKLRIEYETKLNAMPFTYSVLPASGNHGREAETASAGQEFAESGGIADTDCAGLRAEKEILEEGCALTTIYFNQCRSTLDADALVCERAQ